MNRKTKIVATIGPSSEQDSILRNLIESGVDVARLNFSHGSHEEHAVRIEKIRRLSDQLKKPITILLDLQGPKLRVGSLPPDGIWLESGQRLVLCAPEKKECVLKLEPGKTIIPLEVPNLVSIIQKGKRILLNDGYLELEVTDIKADQIEAEVILGGLLTSHKGVNLPGIPIQIPSLTPKDQADLDFGLQSGVDAIALSFVRTPQDILQVRDYIQNFHPQKTSTLIISKLERPEAINNLDAIMKVTDGVMVARGDLAVETSPAYVPIMQKRIIETANYYARVVITATQMLDSMIQYPRPTRAEASDVANAILDGTDAVMLSAETAAGKYPLESVRMMVDIICEAEANFEKWGHCQTSPPEPTQDDAVSITRAARELAKDRNVACIAVFTRSGKTARLMSKTRPDVPIIAFTPEITTYQQLNILWGITPFLVPYASNVESMVSHVEAIMVSNKLLKPGQQFVLISGFPVGAMRPPNLAMLHTVGDPV